jgi:osmotically-inducible protein OsmY
MSQWNRFNSIVVVSLMAGSLAACAAMTGRETMGEYMDDATITTKVKTALVDEPSLHAFQIHVETFQGVVQLSGFVDSQQQSKKAEQLVRTIKGVHAVKNNIVVR